MKLLHLFVFQLVFYEYLAFMPGLDPMSIAIAAGGLLKTPAGIFAITTLFRKSLQYMKKKINKYSSSCRKEQQPLVFLYVINPKGGIEDIVSRNNLEHKRPWDTKKAQCTEMFPHFLYHEKIDNLRKMTISRKYFL